MTQDEIIRRGEHAERILNEPVVKEAIEGMKKEIIAQWSALEARDSEGRDWVWRHYKVTEKFEALLRSYIATGQYENRIKQESLLQKAGNKIRRFMP